MPYVEAITLDETVFSGAVTGSSPVVDASLVQRVVIYILGTAGVTGGEVVIEEAQSPAGPWTPVLDNPILVPVDSVYTAHIGPQAFQLLRARFTQDVIGGGTATVRFIGATLQSVGGPVVGEYEPILTARVGGVLYPIQRGSVSLTDDLNAVNVLSFSVFDELELWSFTSGESVELRDLVGNLVYAGTVERPRVRRERGMEEGVFHSFECVDYNQIPLRKIVKEAYDNTTFEDIVADIVDKYFAPEGVTIGAIDLGPEYIRKIFDYKRADLVLQELSEDTGYAFWFDYEKRFYFRSRLSVAAPFIATSSIVRYSEVERSRTNYRNRQYVRAGRDLTDPITETFNGDTVRQTFSVGLPIGEEPIALVNGVSLGRVGIAGVEDDLPGIHWLWSKDSSEITQRRDDLPLIDTDRLEVTYRGLYPVLVQAQNDDEISRRMTIEGGSGLYEDIEEHSDIESASIAFDVAVARLQRNGAISETLKIELDMPGLATGMFVHVSLPFLRVDGTYLIQQVTATDAGTETFLRYTATLLLGDAVGGWLAFFQRMMQGRRVESPREGELLLLLRNATEAVAAGELLEITERVGETRIGRARIGLSEIAH